jgi:hypothetical protein
MGLTLIQGQGQRILVMGIATGAKYRRAKRLGRALDRSFAPSEPQKITGIYERKASVPGTSVLPSWFFLPAAYPRRLYALALQKALTNLIIIIIIKI